MTGEPRIHVLHDPEATARAAAEAIARGLRDAIEQRGMAFWAVTGGSTAVGIYQALATPPLRDSVPWDLVHAWWADDRYVGRDHPLSNVLPFDQVLLSASALGGLSGTGADAAQVERGIEPGVRMPVGNVHAPPMARAIAAAGGAEQAAREYDAELRRAGPPVGETGYPVFDVIFVGIGPDGHLFSVFPGSPLFDADAWVSGVPAPTHVEPHLARISMHPGILDAARHVVVVTHGEGKASILATVFGPERDVRRWPAQLAVRDGAEWFLDRAAAASLPSRQSD
jgi:6-phosphogluconolactonase/glucosamine-6-phosphate isomerase/deaminase